MTTDGSDEPPDEPEIKPTDEPPTLADGEPEEQHPRLVCSGCSYEKEVEDSTNIAAWYCPECGERLHSRPPRGGWR